MEQFVVLERQFHREVDWYQLRYPLTKQRFNCRVEESIFCPLTASTLRHSRQEVDTSRVLPFQDASGHFLKTMLWLLSVSSGGTSRGTGRDGLSYSNSPKQHETFSCTTDTSCISFFYHKGRQKRGGVSKHIARFLDETTSNLLLVY